MVEATTPTDGRRAPGWIAPTENYFAEDPLFSPLHRAAWLGDVRVLQGLLNYSKGLPLGKTHLKDLMACDQHERMPVHVAAMQGHHAAVAFLLSCGHACGAENTAKSDNTAESDNTVESDSTGESDSMAEKEDINGDTALELLMAAELKKAEQVEAPDRVVEGREQQLWSLHKTIEITRLEHVLAAKYFSFRHFWFLFLPAALVTAFSAILSFLASSVVIEGHASAEWFTVIVGVLASLSVLIQAVSEQLQFRSRAAMHDSAALDLKSMVQDLEFKSIQAIEYGEQAEDLNKKGQPIIKVDVYQEMFQQVMQACKSLVPPAIEQCFNTLDDRLEESLRGAENLQDYSEDAIVEDIRDAMLDVYILAAHEAQNVLTGQRWWPLSVDVKSAVKQAMDTARNKLKEGVPTSVLPEIENESLGELLVVRIAYFKGYLQNKAKENKAMAHIQKAAHAPSKQGGQSRRQIFPRLTWAPRLKLDTQPESKKFTRSTSMTSTSTGSGRLIASAASSSTA